MSTAPSAEAAQKPSADLGAISEVTLMFRIGRGDSCIDADSLDQAREMLRREEPGDYRVDEIRADPFPSGHPSRAWGGLLRHADGRVEDKPYPWSTRWTIAVTT